jgi:hypothetical protein
MCVEKKAAAEERENHNRSFIQCLPGPNRNPGLPDGIFLYQTTQFWYILEGFRTF